MTITLITAAVLLLLVFLSVAVVIQEFKRKKREQQLGYRVEFISENVLRGEPNQFAVVYHQGAKSEWFYGKVINAEYVLDPQSNPNEMILGVERSIIVTRLASELARNVVTRRIVIRDNNSARNNSARPA